MPICYSALLRRYRTRLRSLVNRFRLHRPESLHFNYRGLAVPYAAFDDLDDWDPELLSGRHFAPEVSLLWHVAQRSHPDGILLAVEEFGLFALYVATQIFPQHRVSAVFSTPSYFIQARRLFQLLDLPCAAWCQNPRNREPVLADARINLIFVSRQQRLPFLAQLPGDCLMLSLEGDLDPVVDTGVLRNREIALMVLPKPPVHSSRRRAQLNRLSFALAEQGLFVDARATQGQRIAVRRWHQRVQPY